MTENAGGGMKREVLILLDVLHLQKFNKEEVTPEDVKDADDEKKERIRQEEEARREAEQLAREKRSEERRVGKE